MKGIIFNLVEEAVTARHGEDAWDQVLDRAGVTGAYTSLELYPDEELRALVASGAELLDTDPGELTRWLGHEALLGLAERYPHFFAPHASTRPFLLTLNDVIHPEVRKLHVNADPPDFGFDEGEGDALLLTYASRRRLCDLAVGMIDGAATHFRETSRLTHDVCMKDGAEACVLTVSFAPAHA
ncbi:heme NO-binding domain-containing protein [Nocardioides marmoribigeumensis]|jgi:hypothetical protein|uniref:Heme NO-binding domain-containing protein n=1 Tax=Nocardioides marmoribigeumensis TaxID=433649 RepID=A0ABU2BZ36_9ACTN|nr:heme NO-binding domain-containing protein [Nocardioides marmoribigeumensis]MDR7363642.1 hypothetical protein [Nocardioides marmoribigeumensis]